MHACIGNFPILERTAKVKRQLHWCILWYIVGGRLNRSTDQRILVQKLQLIGFRINRDFFPDLRIWKLSQIADLAAASYHIMDLLCFEIRTYYGAFIPGVYIRQIGTPWDFWNKYTTLYITESILWILTQIFFGFVDSMFWRIIGFAWTYSRFTFV